MSEVKRPKRLSLLVAYDMANSEEVEVLDATDTYIDELEAALRQAGRDIHDNLCASDTGYCCTAHLDIIEALEDTHE